MVTAKVSTGTRSRTLSCLSQVNSSLVSSSWTACSYGLRTNVSTCQEGKRTHVFAWLCPRVTGPFQQFAGSRPNLPVGIRFLQSQNMPTRDEQLARNGHNRLLLTNASTQPLKLSFPVGVMLDRHPGRFHHHSA